MPSGTAPDSVLRSKFKLPIATTLQKITILVLFFIVTFSYTEAASLEQSGPLVITGTTDYTISDIAISNPDGPCVTIQDSTKIRIIRSLIGPCGGNGIDILSSENVQLRLNVLRDISGDGVHIVQSTDVLVTGNQVLDAVAGIRAVSSQSVQVEYNAVMDVTGPLANFVQFDKVFGGGNRIRFNVGRNAIGSGGLEDGISIFKSSGLPEDPIRIVGNHISGGGPSLTGSGITVGDRGGENIVVELNVLVDTGSVGIGVAGGQAIVVRRNAVFTRSQPWTRLGIYVWNQSDRPCGGIVVSDNYVRWFDSDGFISPRWRASNCGKVAGWESNDWNSATRAPIAVAGSDLTAKVGETVSLDGSGSRDPDGDTLRYSWGFTIAPAFVSQGGGFDTANPWFIPEVPGLYELEIRVTDGVLRSTDRARVEVLVPG